MSSDIFNTVEGVFWIVLGIGTSVAAHFVPMTYKRLAYFSALVLIAFGVSDFMQVQYGTFLVPDVEWLLIWKIINVGCLIGCFVWYFVLRMRSN